MLVLATRIKTSKQWLQIIGIGLGLGLGLGLELGLGVGLGLRLGLGLELGGKYVFTTVSVLGSVPYKEGGFCC